jgi:iron-sulfur cluster assembly accessory protein
MIDLTESAVEQLNTICKEQKCYGVSLNLKGGGCAGFEYEWGTISAEDVEEGDHVIDLEHGKFVVGNASLLYLIGTTVDYKKDIMGSMFELDNPNAQSSCGCGVSVNFNDPMGGLF